MPSPARLLTVKGKGSNDDDCGGGGGNDDDGDYYDGQQYNPPGQYRALVMIINSSSQIISRIKSTYVRPSLFFNENEYCRSDCQQHSDSH